MLEKIDRVFISVEWDSMFPSHDLRSLALLCSDHAPLLLCTDGNFRLKKRFVFRSFWPSFQRAPGCRAKGLALSAKEREALSMP
jgi:hypothetical protein